MARLIHYKSCMGMICLFDLLYKEGVRDALLCDDLGRIGEFLESVRVPGVFGTLNSGGLYSWREWRSRLYFKTSETRSYKAFIQEYLTEANEYAGHFACLYPIAFDFYLAGISDYASVSVSPVTMTAFERESNVNLPKLARGEKAYKVKQTDYIGMVQNFAYDRKNLDGEYAGVSNMARKLHPGCYRKFANEFWLAISAYNALAKAERATARLKKVQDEATRGKIGVRTDTEFDKGVKP